MSATDILASLGFTNSAIVGDKRGIVTVRVRTTDGWVYEKFKADNLSAEITAWAAKRTPE